MTQISAISARDLKDRRQSLRLQRRLTLLQGFWRTLALSGLTAGLFWGATRPFWLIQGAAQIEVTGNQRLSDQAIHSLLAIQYPQPLLKLQPKAIAQQLKSKAPITEAVVTRQLFPPQLNVQVQERVPVAVALPATEAASAQAGYIQDGLIDAAGVWMPKSSFALYGSRPELPDLEVRGMQAQYQAYWPSLYQAIAQSPVAVSVLDWQDPSNLILHTELGIVHLGAYPDRFAEKLSTLDQMRNLTQQFDRKRLAYIDLTNPDLPSVQVMQAARPAQSNP